MAVTRILRSRRVLSPEGWRSASVYVSDGRVARVAEHGDVPAGAPVHDLGDLALLPGVVDSHVHINEPGRTEWEGFETATRAAAAGGTTTVVDMPLNSIPPATTVRGVAEKAAVMEGRCTVDVGLWGGAVPENTAGDPRGLGAILGEGALGFKCFLVPSGVDEFPYVRESEVRAALAQLRGTGATLMVHAELPGPIDAAERAMRAETPPPDPRAYATYLRSRPPSAEDEAVALLYRLCKETGTPIHVVHLSSAGALETLARARDEGLPLSAETAPHYLCFDAEEIPDGATWFKCAPPIRARANRDLLWKALDDGLISMVVSDHSPCTPDLKRRDTGDFMAAWGGIAGLQFSFSAVWTEASRRGVPLDRVSRWMSAAPARLAGIASRKGSIAPGHDADFVAFDDAGEFTVEAPRVFHRNPLSPYVGRRLRGVVRETWVRGERVYDGQGFANRPAGRWIPRV